jgi:hypothetical protein
MQGQVDSKGGIRCINVNQSANRCDASWYGSSIRGHLGESLEKYAEAVLSVHLDESTLWLPRSREHMQEEDG